MKRIIGHFKSVHKAAYLFMFASCLSFYSCEKYDDTKLWEEVNDLQERVYKLEEMCKQTNTNIASIQSLLTAMENNYSIVSIIPLEGDKGYTITFTNDKSITIYHGENGKDGIDGEDGKDGTDGKDGADGEDGKDGMTPQIGIKDMGDGNYCWTLNGEVLKDAEGNPIRANGKDGVDGEDGKDGEDGSNGTNGSNGSSAPIPQVKTGLQLSNAGISGNWDKTAVYLSVDGGATWTKISSEGNNSIFASVDTSKDDCVVFTLADGTVITLPKTDKILDMLFGTWIRLNQRFDTVLDDKIIFNSDFTIQEIVEGSVCGYGPFKYYPDKQMIVADYGYGNNEVQVFRIAEITDNMLYLIDDWQHRAYTLY